MLKNRLASEKMVCIMTQIAEESIWRLKTGWDRRRLWTLWWLTVGSHHRRYGLYLMIHMAVHRHAGKPFCKQTQHKTIDRNRLWYHRSLWTILSVEDDNFLTEGWGCVNLMIFIWEFFNVLVWQRERIIPGHLGFAISVCRSRERGRMSKSVYARVFHDLELLRYILRCAIGQQL